MKKLIVAVMMVVISVPAMADTGGAILGALVLGALGNQIGDGNGKKIATVVGALAGASIGSRLEDGTYGKDANGEYVCTNCNGTTYAQQQYQQQQYQSAGEQAAAHRGAAEYAARVQCQRESNAYYSNGGSGQYQCSNGYNGGYNYAGSYYNRNQNIQWR